VRKIKVRGFERSDDDVFGRWGLRSEIGGEFLLTRQNKTNRVCFGHHLDASSCCRSAWLPSEHLPHRLRFNLRLPFDILRLICGWQGTPTFWAASLLIGSAVGYDRVDNLPLWIALAECASS
jgi:hypothetical protein